MYTVLYYTEIRFEWFQKVFIYVPRSYSRATLTFVIQGIMITMITTTTCKGMRPTCKSEWSCVTVRKQINHLNILLHYIHLCERIQKIINQLFSQQAGLLKSVVKNISALQTQARRILHWLWPQLLYKGWTYLTIVLSWKI